MAKAELELQGEDLSWVMANDPGVFNVEVIDSGASGVVYIVFNTSTTQVRPRLCVQLE